MTTLSGKDYDAIGLAELVRQGEITPLELVEDAINRIEKNNPQLNAVVTTMYDQAREAAIADLSDSPLAGVPFLLKDLSALYADVRMTAGSAALQNYISPIDNEIVRRFKRAGLITLGKTNTPEFGLLPTTESISLGACHNPWDITRMPGGSSGGSAAAVAAGLVPLAHASDGGGSIRIPASCCGVFGLKPTRARTPQGPTNGDVMSGISISNCVSRSVRDSAALLDAIAGPDLGDPYWAPSQKRPFLSETQRDPGKLRIAYTKTSLGSHPVHADCVTAVEDTAQLCSNLGHEVSEMAPAFPYEQFTEAFLVVWAAGCAWTVKSISRMMGQPPSPAHFEPLTWAFYQMAEKQTSADYLLAVQTLQQHARIIAHTFQEIDVWLTPVVSEPPLPLGEFDATPDNPLRGLERATGFAAFTPIANVTGQPAMSVPLYWNGDGLPIGSHFTGRFGDEGTLFRLAAQLERERPWRNKRPPVH